MKRLPVVVCPRMTTVVREARMEGSRTRARRCATRIFAWRPLTAARTDLASAGTRSVTHGRQRASAQGIAVERLL